MSRYPMPEEGEWVQPVMKGYKFACCDCGLVHRMDSRIVDDIGEVMDGFPVTGQPVVQFRVCRDSRATGQVRRHMNREGGGS